MANLSTPIGELRSRYDVVVVGSGYGGAVAAYRMAEAAGQYRRAPAFSVCLLERGLEIRPGNYPSSAAKALGQIQADTPRGHIGRRTGLFDFRINRDISVLVGCGLGGTSLINAGVMLKPRDAVLTDDAWPEALQSATALNDEFKRVMEMLDAKRVPRDPPLLKVERLAEAAEAAPSGGVKRTSPPIAVSFETAVNRFGVQQQRCVLCGDCMTGCNHSAKNTLIMNYLPAAATAGASIFCGMDVRAVERGRDGLWLLRVRMFDKAWGWFGRPEFTIEARTVFLGCGALGSTEILLRSRHPVSLPLSSQLGRHFSGNGDVIAFAYNARDPVNGIGHGTHVPRGASVGPAIAGMLDERDVANGSGAMIQEGAMPGALAPILRFAAPFMARATHMVADATFDFSFRHLWRELDSMIRGVHHGALLRTQTFLAMSRDSADGVMRLRGNRLRISWPLADDERVFGKVTDRLRDLTRAMKGRYVMKFWSRAFGRRLITVHPLGGCRMGDSADKAVVDGDGRVFKGDTGDKVHDGLYVCDGAIVPLALGTNPALTIAALAERIVGRAAGRMLRDVAPESDAQPGRQGGADARLRRDERPARVLPLIGGIRYAERLRGRMELDDGRATPLDLTLHISAERLDELITGDGHVARIVGVARMRDFDAERGRCIVTDGTLSVLVDDERQVDTKLIVYRMKLSARDGTVLWLLGSKTINLATLRRGFWRAVSRLPFTVYTEQWVRTGSGVAQNSVADALRLFASMHVTHEPSRLQRVRALCRYGWFFTDGLIQARVWALARPVQINPFARPQESDPDRDNIAGRTVKEKDRILDWQKRFVITRYRPRLEKGETPQDDSVPPVVLAPGFGMSTFAFRLGHPSIAKFLYDSGYQVWLLDYRGSDALDASLEQFTLDDIAIKDFPDAFRRVRLHTGQRIQVVAHCAASLAFFMGVLTGRITATDVRSVVLSQSFAYMDQPFLNRLKARLRLPQLLRWLNFRPVLTADYDLRTGWRGRMLDRILRFYPSAERCTNGVCRRLLLLYGEVFRHDQLDRETHDKVYEMFDRANLTMFVHLAQMISHGRIVDVKGRDIYLIPENAKKIDFPVTLIQGCGNGLFRPGGAKKTYRWLVENGRDPELFELRHVPQKGHLDTFIGKDAHRDSFPLILEALRRQ